jgi:DNA-binding NarL/FixJ family response regulator
MGVLKIIRGLKSMSKKSNNNFSRKLTERQKEIAELKLGGMNHIMIGKTLKISPNTVKNTMVNILLKLGATSRKDFEVLYKQYLEWEQK